MFQNKHTTGSWNLYDTKSDHVVHQGGRVIARVRLRHKEDEANAYLISQAPKMKKALVDLLTWYDMDEGDLRPLMNAARVVLEATDMPTWADEFPGFNGREEVTR